MEPETKVFPAIFVEATSKEVLQIELGRTSTTLPLSAALLQNSERHVIPQVGKVSLFVTFKREKF
jgi:ryanodine receptor 2